MSGKKKQYIEDTEEGTFHKGCNGTVVRDHRLSRIEEYHGHRKYTCNKCGVSFKYWMYGETIK